MGSIWKEIGGVADGGDCQATASWSRRFHWDGLTIDGSYRGNGWGELAP